MPDPSLHGNGFTCPACALQRETDLERTRFGSLKIDCNICNGTGRIAKTITQIYTESVALAQQHHWRL
ncbi:hypothetical protein KL867_05220 [Ruegeria litorea]|uniref:Transcription factor zinc-finger domain-containing protein n=1 Tax=Falsiruegeria litorea TaxID=1280831 RepID=A0ABS5WRE7_9RHOB|nr:hypothetical protein [Falsiruegeria litorea]MBT3140440.1 hypothetical protein [Falsiruegeria litorea]